MPPAKRARTGDAQVPAQPAQPDSLKTAVILRNYEDPVILFPLFEGGSDHFMLPLEDGDIRVQLPGREDSSPLVDYPSLSRVVSPAIEGLNVLAVDSLTAMAEILPCLQGLYTDDSAFFHSDFTQRVRNSPYTFQLLSGVTTDETDRMKAALYGKSLFQRQHDTISKHHWNKLELGADQLEDGYIVPDLNKYLYPKSALVVQFDCATQKSRHIMRLIRERLLFNGSLRVVLISCRIVHASDLKAELDRHFPEGSGVEFDIYSKKVNSDDGRFDPTQPRRMYDRLVVQLNSVTGYCKKPYDLVIMDEICSILAYLELDNPTLMTTVKDEYGRSLGKVCTLTEHVGTLEFFCHNADALVVADAHIDRDSRVRDFLGGVVPEGRTITHLIGVNKNPACKRTLKIRFNPNPHQTPMEDVVRMAVERLREDPENRIFIFCSSKNILAKFDRGKDGECGSYEECLRKCGIESDRICAIHGRAGEDTKKDLFADLDTELKNYDAWIVTSAVTVGANPMVKFGTVIAHTHRKGCDIRDMFQSLQRVGRKEGLLTDNAIYMTINDCSPEEKDLSRKEKIARNKKVEVPTLKKCTANVRKALTTRKAQMSSITKILPGDEGTPDWLVNVMAGNELEAMLTQQRHSETIFQYAEFHGWDIELLDLPAGDVIGEPEGEETEETMQNEEAFFSTGINEQAYSRVVTYITDFDYDQGSKKYSKRTADDTVSEIHARVLAYWDALDSQTAATREREKAELSSMQKCVNDVYYKVYKLLGGVLDTRGGEPVPFGVDDAAFLWDNHQSLTRRGLQVLEEVCPGQKASLDARLAFTDGSGIDYMRKLESQTLQPMDELRGWLGIGSIVQGRFNLPQRVIDIINFQQNASVGDVVTRACGFDGDDEVYAIFQKFGKRIKKPKNDPKNVNRSSVFLQDLVKVLKEVGMEPYWDNHQGKNDRKWEKSPVDGNLVLKPGFGFWPAKQDIADQVLVYVPQMNRTMKVGDLITTNREKVTRLYEDTLEELQRLEAIKPRYMPVHRTPGRYTEFFDVKTLKSLYDLIKARTSQEDFNINFKEEHGFSEGQVLKMIYDANKFLDIAKTHETTLEALGDEELRGTFTDDQRKLLHFGFSLNRVEYHYKFGDGLGRRYADGVSFQGVKREVRCALAGKIYYDLDFENSYPTIVYNTYLQKGGDVSMIPYFKRYMTSREALLAEVMVYYEVGRKAAKNLFLMVLHGGGLDSRRDDKGWMNKWLPAGPTGDRVRAKVADAGHLDIADGFKDEVTEVCTILLQAYPEYKTTLDQINEKLPEEERKTGRPGHFSALSYLMATLEDSLLKSFETFLAGEGYTVDSLEFDGLKVRRKYKINEETDSIEWEEGPFPEEVLREAEDHLAGQELPGGVKIPMKLSEKPMELPFGL